MRFGILTGGGDCPGLNAVIRAAVRKGIGHYGHSFVGFRDGWRGVLRDGEHDELTIESTKGILHRGGTILGSSRTNPFKREDGPGEVRETLTTLDLDGLIAIGGEDTLGAATNCTVRASPCSAFRRRSTTISARPTRRSGSTPPYTSRQRRSTACTRQPRATNES